jgi:Holliday junction resolvase
MSESELVRAFNDYFIENAVPGIAFRRKQHRFTSQYCDILVDSAHQDHQYLAIEHKSFKTSSSSKLYFSQHFSSETDEDELDSGHQIERISEFEERTGRKAYLAVEVRQGRGKPKKLFFMEWSNLVRFFRDWKNTDNSKPGFSPGWMEENCVKAEREDGYKIPAEVAKSS